jgi:peptidoglycan-N-acetylglucosamine deacetylase
VARHSLFRAHVFGFVSYFAAFLLALFDVSLAVVPLFLFVVLCMVAPFLPRFGFFLPIISRGNSGQKAVSITFDDGPDPFTTEPLLTLLDRHGVKATFFVLGKKAAAHPQLIKKILKKGHLLGNHSYSHDNLCMLKSSKHLFREISTAQEVLARFHVRPLAFRPPVGITNPKLWRVLKELGMVNVNFSCRGLDAGNRRLNGLSKRVLKHLRSDHIIALHDVMPKRHAALKLWLNEIDKVLQGIKDRRLKVLPLPELIGRPVMIWVPDANEERHLWVTEKKA